MKTTVKKRILTVLTALVCALTVITAVNSTADISTVHAAAIIVPGNSIIGNPAVKMLPNYPAFQQGGKHDCWQYTIRSITKYKYNYYPTVNEYYYLEGQYYGSTGSQPFNNSLPNINTSPNVLDMPLTEEAHEFFLKNYFGNSVKLYHRRLTYNEIIENINNQKPITMLLKSENGNGHAVVIVGYTLKPGSPSGIQYLKCMEPANGKFVNIPTSGPGRDSIKYNRFDGKEYTWAKSITI